MIGHAIKVLEGANSTPPPGTVSTTIAPERVRPHVTGPMSATYIVLPRTSCCRCRSCRYRRSHAALEAPVQANAGRYMAEVLGVTQIKCPELHTRQERAATLLGSRGKSTGTLSSGSEVDKIA